MSIISLIIGGGGLVGGVVSLIIALRVSRGTVRTSEAKDLWGAEAGFRTDLLGRLNTLQERCTHLEEQLSTATTALLGNVQDKQEIARLKDELARLRRGGRS